MIKPGDKVTYVAPFKKEHGIMKAQSIDSNYIFVVYNCGGNWNNFMNYTGACTRIEDLVEGWI